MSKKPLVITGAGNNKYFQGNLVRLPTYWESFSLQTVLSSKD